MVPRYTGTMVTSEKTWTVERVQTGVRLEKLLRKVLKGFAELHDLSLGDLLEGIVLHAFEGKSVLSSESCKQIEELKRFYGLDLPASASHKLVERWLAWKQP